MLERDQAYHDLQEHGYSQDPASSAKPTQSPLADLQPEVPKDPAQGPKPELAKASLRCRKDLVLDIQAWEVLNLGFRV